jgi:hypothetical protein
MVADKFLNLKCLEIHICAKAFSPAYDYLSLVSFLDASPALETFILSVSCFSSCNSIQKVSVCLAISVVRFKGH